MDLPFKISVLVFVRNEKDQHLLIERGKAPNLGLWSPIGGKLEMAAGESPFVCAIRETKEEIGLELSARDLHLFSMVSERAYERGSHWLMFLFDCKKRISSLPPKISEGNFAFFETEKIFSGLVPIPETDRLLLWDIWKERHETGMTVLLADCEHGVRAIIEENI